MQKEPNMSSSLQEKRLALQDKARALGNQLSTLGAGATASNADAAADGMHPNIDDPVLLTDQIASLAAEAKSWRDKAEHSESQVKVLAQELVDSQKENETAQVLNLALEAKVSQLKEEVRHTESALKRSYNDTLEGLTEHMKTLESHAAEVANENEELRFQLTEAQRVCKFLEGKASSTGRQSTGQESEEMIALREENAHLQEQLHGLEKTLNKSYNETLDGLTRAMEEHHAEHQDLQVENDGLRFSSTESQRISKFLQAKCEKMATDHEARERELSTLLAEEKFQRTEAQRVSKYLQTKCEKMVVDHEARERELLALLAEEKFQRTEAQRVSKFLQTKCEQLVRDKDANERPKASVNAVSSAETDFAKIEAERLSKFLQEKCEKLVREKEATIQAHASAIAEANFAKTEAERVANFLQQKCEKLVEQQSVTKKEHEEAIADLTFQKTEAQRVSKFLEAKLQKVLADSPTQSEAISRNVPRVMDDEESESSSSDSSSSVDSENEALQARVQELENMVNRLEKEAKDTEKELHKPSNIEVEDLTKKNQSLEKHLKKLYAQVDQMREMVTEMDEACEGWEIKCSKLELELEKQLKKHENAVANHKKKLEKNERYVKFLDGKMAALEERNSHLLQELDQYRVEYYSDEEGSESGTDEDDANEENVQASEVNEDRPSGGTGAAACRDLNDISSDDDDEPVGTGQDLAVLFRRNQELEGMVATLKKEAKKTEAALNKSYNETLDGLTDHIAALDEQIEELTSQNEELLEDQSMDVLGRKIQTMIKEKKAIIAEKDDINNQLTESKRVASFLEEKLNAILDEKKAVEAAKDDVVFQLTETTRVSKFLETKLNAMLDEKKATQARMDDLNFQLTEAKRVSSFLESKLEKVLHEQQQVQTTPNKNADESPTRTLAALPASTANHDNSALEDQIRVLDSENNDLRFAKTEAERVCKFLQGKLEESKKSSRAELENEALKEKIAALEKEQGEVNRMKMDLSSSLAAFEQQMMEGGSTTSSVKAEELQATIKQLEQTIVDMKKEAKLSEESLNKSYNETLDGLTAHIQELEEQLEESQLVLSRNVGGSSDSETAQVKKERDVLKEKAVDLGVRMTAMKKDLSQKDDDIEELKEMYKEMERKYVDMKQAAQETEEHLNKSYNDTLTGLTLHIQEAEQKIQELLDENEELRQGILESQAACESLEDKLQKAESTSAPSSDETDFRLIEAQRVSKFLEDKLTRLVREKEISDGRIADLQAQVEKFRVEIVTMDMVIAKQKDKLAQQNSEEDELEESQENVVASKVTSAHPEDLSGSSQLVEALSACLSMARTSQKATEDKVAALTSELADKENQVQQYKEKLESEVAKTEELTEQVAELKESSKIQAQGEQTSEKSKPVGISKINTMGFVCVPVRRVEGRPGSGPLYFM